MALSQSASENGWMTYPAELWNKHEGEPVGPHVFWARCVEKYGGPILEVGCGNGRWLLPLAQHGPGYEVVGVDINKALIATARQRVESLAAAGRRVDATFVVGDIVHLDLGRTFPLVIMASWTFQVLLTQEDQLAFLDRVREHLRPGGAFAFNLCIPFHRQRGLTEKDGVYEWPSNPNYQDGAPRTYDPTSQVETMLDHNVHPIKLRHTSLTELTLLFRLTGLRLVEIYGDDEDLRPFNGGPHNDYTIIAERA